MPHITIHKPAIRTEILDQGDIYDMLIIVPMINIIPPRIPIIGSI